MARTSVKLSIKPLVLAILEEVRQKHQIDCINDDYLNDDYHVEITLTIGEIKEAAKHLKIKDF